MSTSETKPDIIIVGSGLAGMAAALALGPPATRGDLRVTLVAGTNRNGQFNDPRAFAIARSSQRMLYAMGLWRDLAPHVEPLREIVVSDSRPEDEKRPELLHFPSGAKGNGPAAFFVEGSTLYKVLASHVEQKRNVQVMHDDMSRLDISAGRIEVEMTSGQKVEAPLIIAADGKDSPSRATAAIEAFEFDYSQAGIAATIEHELPHGGRAYEHFLPAGPFAVLPLRGNRSSIVWTEARDNALRLVESEDRIFLSALRRRVGHRLGQIKLSGPRAAFPLSLMIAKTFGKRRIALIGEAAHVIHPLAGLGFNLGLRDIAALAEAVVEDYRLGLDIGSEATLDKYQRRRRLDTMVTAMATDGLNRLFSNDVQAVRQIRHLGLRIVDRLPSIKNFLQQEAAGVIGDLPRLMRGEVI
jgi:2-octaprenyl-6-methoxyphenol hydroxylase